MCYSISSTYIVPDSLVCLSPAGLSSERVGAADFSPLLFSDFSLVSCSPMPAWLHSEEEIHAQISSTHDILGGIMDTGSVVVYSPVFLGVM